MSALITDSLRSNILEMLGYKVQVLEFIDMEHTPKNIMIRAVKNKITKQKIQVLQPAQEPELCSKLSLSPEIWK